tara:strand:+ start:720 stop:1004 length:285 start_codon:yes stop_codon:yes gene_type:complete
MSDNTSDDMVIAIMPKKFCRHGYDTNIAVCLLCDGTYIHQDKVAQLIAHKVNEAKIEQQKQVILWATQIQPDNEGLHTALNNGLSQLKADTTED